MRRLLFCAAVHGLHYRGRSLGLEGWDEENSCLTTGLLFQGGGFEKVNSGRLIIRYKRVSIVGGLKS